MSDAFIEQAKSERNVLERLIKGLPFVRGYTDKEMRRNADYRVRQLIGGELDASRTALYNIQNELMNGGGIAYVGKVDRAVSMISTLSDKVKTASYGYAGLFDTVGIQEDQLDALHRFDVALLSNVAKIESSISALAQSLGNPDGIDEAIRNVTTAAGELSSLFDRRGQAIVSPDLLTGYAPNVERFEELNLDSPAPAGGYTAGPPEDFGYSEGGTEASNYTDPAQRSGTVDMSNFEAIETGSHELTEGGSGSVDMSNFELTDDEK